MLGVMLQIRPAQTGAPLKLSRPPRFSGGRLSVYVVFLSGVARFFLPRDVCAACDAVEGPLFDVAIRVALPEPKRMQPHSYISRFSPNGGFPKMSANATAAHEAPPTQQPLPGLADHAPNPPDPHSRSRRPQPARPANPPTDDEILGLDPPSPRTHDPAQSNFDFDATTDAESAPPSEGAAAAPASNPADETAAADPANYRNIFEANPELRRAWQDANAYRETFSTPEAARAATAQLADLDRMDALFFSRRPEDHAELARAVATLDPEAFASLAQAITTLASAPPLPRDDASSVGAQEVGPPGRRLVEPGGSVVPGANTWQHDTHPASTSGRAGNVAQVFRPEGLRPQSDHPSRQPEAAATPQRQSAQTTAAQAEFFHAANAAAVEGVLDAIESQVERLLPEGVSKSARNRVVGEIYRELDTTLRSNRQLGQQMRDAFRSGSLDTDHQRATLP